MIYFISGHRNLSLEEFNKTYVNKINSILNKDKNASFIVGDYYGVDKYAMDFIYKITKCKLTICHMHDKPRNLPEGFSGKDPRVLIIGGFISDIGRDSYMTNHSDFDIAFVKDNRWTSGTAQNIIRRNNI